MAQFKDLIEDLMDKWRQLKDAVDHRRNQLNQSEKAQQVSPLLFVSTPIIFIWYLKFQELLNTQIMAQWVLDC